MTKRYYTVVFEYNEGDEKFLQNLKNITGKLGQENAYHGASIIYCGDGDLASENEALSAVLVNDGIDPVVVAKIDFNEVERLIAERIEANKAENWDKAAELETKLIELGVGVEDTFYGTNWWVLKSGM